MSYAVICDSRQSDSVLVLVDRTRTRAQWWTETNSNIAMQFTKKSAAQAACNRLRHNQARVVPFSEAIELLAAQKADAEHDNAMDCVESGWDGQKWWTS